MAILASAHIRRRQNMKRSSLIMGAGLAVLASAPLVLASANAAPVDTGHEAAIKACSTVNPAQPVKL
jgi:hypothetical protein